MKLIKALKLLLAQNLFLRKIYNIRGHFFKLFNSYSQHQEDIIIDKLLKNKKKGFMLILEQITLLVSITQKDFMIKVGTESI